MTTATPQRTDRWPLLLVWLVLALVLVDVVIGGGWDAEYHRTQPFDGFFSPPHVFIYTVATILLAVVTYMNLDGRVRPAFGAALVLAARHARCLARLLPRPAGAVSERRGGRD